ncbi:MAG: hypothetical protein ACLR3C_13740 [Eggerthella lenta]
MSAPWIGALASSVGGFIMWVTSCSPSSWASSCRLSSARTGLPISSATSAPLSVTGLAGGAALAGAAAMVGSPC